jgi:hypothetical protein
MNQDHDAERDASRARAPRAAAGALGCCIIYFRDGSTRRDRNIDEDECSRRSDRAGAERCEWTSGGCPDE